MDIELNDWEVLATDDDSNPVIQNPPSSYLEGIENDSQGIIKSDYFSLDSHIKYPSSSSSSPSPSPASDDVTDKISVASDNPSWVDPVHDNSYTKSKPVSGFWSSDCSSDDDVIKFAEPGPEPELEPESSEYDCRISEVNAVVAKETDVINDGEEKVENSVKMDGSGDDKGGVVVWWKLPIDLLRFCLFKASPVWSISVAAAMMGVVILSRRLYKMKRKTRTLQLKVAVDDKKVSQVMSRAAKLNEAFSVVKRSPIIRPQLPATGIAPWPMMAIR